MGVVRYIIIAALVALQCLGIPEYMTDGPYWLRATTYSFFHANWWHLAVNCLAVWTVYPPKRRCKPCRDFVFPILIAMAVYPLSLRPVIGYSNILYATLGLRTPALSSPWWKQPAVIAFLVATVAMLFIPRFSATTHIAAFVLGMALAAAGRWWDNLTRDARRYY